MEAGNRRQGRRSQAATSGSGLVWEHRHSARGVGTHTSAFFWIDSSSSQGLCGCPTHSLLSRPQVSMALLVSVQAILLMPKSPHTSDVLMVRAHTTALL